MVLDADRDGALSEIERQDAREREAVAAVELDRPRGRDRHRRSAGGRGRPVRHGERRRRAPRPPPGAPGPRFPARGASATVLPAGRRWRRPATRTGARAGSGRRPDAAPTAPRASWRGGTRCGAPAGPPRPARRACCRSRSMRSWSSCVADCADLRTVETTAAHAWRDRNASISARVAARSVISALVKRKSTTLSSYRGARSWAAAIGSCWIY